MEQVSILILIVLCMLSHIGAITGGIMVIRKYEDYLQNMSQWTLFNKENFCAQRLWFVILSLFISFGYLIFSFEHFIKVLDAFHGLHILKYILMNLSVGLLVLQYNYYILKDRRN